MITKLRKNHQKDIPVQTFRGMFKCKAHDL